MGDASIGEVLTLQAWGSEFDPQSPCVRAGHCGVCLILAYSWDSSARQPVLAEGLATRAVGDLVSWGGGATPALASFSVALLNAKNLGGGKGLFHFTLPSNSLSLRRGEGRKSG